MARIKAQEARIKSSEALDANEKYIVNHIDNEIREACNLGHYHIWYRDTLTDKIITDLKNHGYEIEDLSSHKNRDTFRISW